MMHGPINIRLNIIFHLILYVITFRCIEVMAVEIHMLRILSVEQ